jgi:hypothetical protein
MATAFQIDAFQANAFQTQVGFLWNDIDVSQNPSWQFAGEVPSGNWTQIVNSATLSWVPVASTQAAGWGAVDTTQTPTWTDVNT